MNRSTPNFLGLLALFVAGLFFAAAGIGFKLGTLSTIREIGLGLLFFVIAILLGFGWWVLKA